MTCVLKQYFDFFSSRRRHTRCSRDWSSDVCSSDLAFTYSCHPVGCAVALATLDIIEREDFPKQAAQKGRFFLSRLRDALADHPHVGDVRGLGLMAAVEYVRDKSTKEEFAPEEKVGHRVHVAAQERGLFSRLRGDVFCLAPPIITTEQQLDKIVEIMRDATDAVLGKPHNDSQRLPLPTAE